MKNRCVICDNDDITRINAFFVPFLRERMFDNQNIESGFIHCNNCGCYYAEHRPTDEQMSKLYTNYRSEEYQKQRQKSEPYYTPEFNYALGNLEEMIQIRKNHLSKLLSCFTDVSKIKNVLDYGGDNGQFIPESLNNANKYVYEISGVTPIKGVMSINSKDELTKQPWDLIMCCHVLEHVSSPMEIIKEISLIMPKGGYLYIEIPYEEYIEGFSNANPAPIHEHINLFRLKTFEKMFDNNEFIILTNKLYEQSSKLGHGKIISCLVQKLDKNELNIELSVLKEIKNEILSLRAELADLKAFQEQSAIVSNQVSSIVSNQISKLEVDITEIKQTQFLQIQNSETKM